MIFTAATLAAFIAANRCVPPKAADVMIGIAQTESALNSLSIHDNTAAVSFTPSSAGEAIHLAQSLIAHHHDLDVGIGNVNIRNFPWLGLTLATAFEPCSNLSAATRVLFVRYNGNPPDAQKVAYAKSVIAHIPDGKPPPVGGLSQPPPPMPLRDALHDSGSTLVDLVVHRQPAPEPTQTEEVKP